MKNKTKHILKSCLSLMLAFCMMFTLAVPVQAEEGTDETTTVVSAASGVQDINGDGKITYVTFGDSVTNGYGMTGYRYDDGTNVLGFRREVEGSYPAEIKEYLEGQGWNVDLEQMAISGFRMDELHWMLGDDYVSDYYHDTRFANWNHKAIDRMLRSTDEEAQAAANELRSKYPQYSNDASMVANADAIIMNEYRTAVQNADLVTIDLGTNNFGTFLTSTISDILTGGEIETETVDFSNYVDEKTAATLDGIIDQMAAQMAGGSTTSQAFVLTQTLSRCMMYGYLGFTEHYDGALDALYQLNPNAKVIVLDMYTMISGVQLSGQALGDVDLDQMYNLFINMANFYANELSPYAQKVTHASLENDPALLIDDYINYVYPDSQGTLVAMYQKDAEGNYIKDAEGNLVPNPDYNETAVTLLNEFIMEAQGMDPDDPAQREQFQKSVVDNIELLDTYVYDLQATIQKMVVDEQILPGVEEQIQPIELAMDAIDLIYTAVDGVAQAEAGVDAAIEGVPTAKEAVQTAVNGVATAKEAVKTAVDGVATAEEAVNTAVEGVALAQQIVDLVVNNLIEGEYSSYFSGSATSSMFKSIIVSKIEEYVTDDLMKQAGFEPTDENRTMLAEEVYVMACVYYDELNVNGGTKESANKLAIIEGLRFMLVEAKGYSAAEAQTTAEQAYDLNAIYQSQGEKAAVIAAMETKVDSETAALAYEINAVYEKDGEKAAIIAAIASQLTDEQVSSLGLTDKTEAAELVYELNSIYQSQGEKAAVIKAMAVVLKDEEKAALAYDLYAVYEANGGADNHEAARKAAIIAAVKSQLTAEMLEGFGITTDQGAEMAYNVAASYNTLKANGASEQDAVVQCLIAVASQLGMDIDEETAATGYQLYVGVYKPAAEGGADKDTAKKNTVIYAVQTELQKAGKSEAEAKAIAEALYAVYKEQATDGKTEATDEQQKLAYISAMVMAEIPEDVAKAIYECYCPTPVEGEETKENLDGLYKDPNVQTTIIFFMTQVLEDVDTDEAAELFDSYLLYKNIAETLGKISRLHTIYFDSLLKKVNSDGGINVAAIAEEIKAGTLVLEEPVQGIDAEGKEFDESDDAYKERVAKFESDSSLAIFYFRFMAQDGVFTHPSKAGHVTFTNAIINAMNNMVPDAEADQDVVITENTSILSIGDAMVDSENENNYAELIAEKLGVNEVNYAQNNYARLEDYYNALAGETGDAFAEEVVNAAGGVDKELATKVAENDIILVNLGSMNLGYSAMQMAKYMNSETGETYKMTFTDKENMSVRALGATVDGFLADFQQMLGVVDENGNRLDNAPTSVGSIMLLLESYGYGITTYTNDFNNLMGKLHELNPEATIVLVGVGDILGDGYFYDEASGAYFSLGDFYQHGANLLNGHMEKYAAQTANVFYVDTMDAENPANSKETPINVATAGAEILTDAHFTDAGHATVAGKFNCTDLVHFQYLDPSSTEPTCTTDGVKKFSCPLCGKEYDNVVTAATGHSYGDEATWVWAEDHSSAAATVTCTACDENTTDHTFTATATGDAIKATPDTATCTEAGEIVYTASVTIGDKVYTGTTTAATPAAGHIYGGNPEWTWAKDENGTLTGTATATFSCTRGNDCTHKETVDAAVTSVTTDKTCDTDGKIEYTATAIFEDTTYTNNATQTIEKGHEYENGICTVCKQYDPSSRPNPEGNCSTTTAAELKSGATLTLSLGGTAVGTYTFVQSGDGWTIQAADGTYVALKSGALTYSSEAFVWTYADGRFSAAESTSSSSSSNSWFSGIFGNWFGSSSSKTTTYYLVASGSSLAVSTSTTNSNASFTTTSTTNSHTYGDGVVVAPTCTTAGYTEFTCTVCGNVVKMNETEATGHSYVANVVAPTCTADGYTEHACSKCGDKYKDAAVSATGHNYVDGVCSTCGAVEQTETPCVYMKEVSLTSGTYELRLGGTSVGTYTFAQSGDGWIIMAADGTYLALDNGSLVNSSEAFVWTYSNNRFSATETTSSSSSSNSWFSGIFGNWFGSSSSSSTTYYLVASGSSVGVSTSTSNAAATFYTETTGTHTYGDPEASNGSHVYTCTACGETKSEVCTDQSCTLCHPEQNQPETPDEPEVPEATINVTVDIEEETSGSSFGSWFGSIFGGLFGSSTTYTATITVEAEGTEVESVAYSTDGGSTWTNGTSFESDEEIENFDIRVEASNGQTYYFTYDNGTVTEK